MPANAERLRWLTGFAGSAGLAVVLKDAAALFVDGRYTEQVKTEADASVFEFRHVTEEPPGEWIARELKSGDKLGYDPRLHTPDAVARLAAACEKAGAGLVAVDANPIDAIWPNRPPAPLGPSPRTRCASPARARRKNRPGAEGDRRVARPSDQRSAQSGVAVQHSRRRRPLYAASARLGLSAGRGPSGRVSRRTKAFSREPPEFSAAMRRCWSRTRCSSFVEDLGRQGAASPSTPRPSRRTDPAVERAGGEAESAPIRSR